MPYKDVALHREAINAARRKRYAELRAAGVPPPKPQTESAKEAANRRAKAWRAANPDKVRAYKKRKYWEDPDKARLKQRERVDKQAAKARSRAYYRSNREYVTQREAAYYRANPEVNRAANRRCAERLTDGYIHKLDKTLPPELYEVKRVQLLIKRQIKEMT